MDVVTHVVIVVVDTHIVVVVARVGLSQCEFQYKIRNIFIYLKMHVTHFY